MNGRTYLKVMVFGKMPEQEIKKIIGLILSEFDNTLCESRMG